MVNRVEKVSEMEIEEAMALEKAVQKDVSYIPTEQETEEINWREYQEKKIAEEAEKRKREYQELMEGFADDLRALD